VLIVLLSLLAVLMGLALILDNAARGWAEERVENSISEKLGENLAGPVQVEILGWPFITQIIAGELDDVEVSDIRLIDEGQISHLVLSAQGVPLDTTQKIDHIEGSLTMNEVATNDWLDDKRPLTGRVAFEEGAVVYTDALSLLGQSIPYTLSVDVEGEGDIVQLSPTDVTVAGAISIPLDTILGALGAQTISVCAADMLPKGATILGIDLAPDQFTLRFAADDVYLSEAALQSVGECEGTS
jgi:hypothetical protein